MTMTLPHALRQPTSAQIRWLKITLFVLGLLPFVRLIVATAINQLGANPVEFITRDTGDWTLYLLCATLAITPLRKLTNLNWLLRVRRMVGVFAFFYAALHFMTFLWFDHGFDVTEMWKDVLKRPFITVGFTAFVLLIPLAVTSTNAMVKWVGGKRWQWLHRLVYLIVPLGVLHFWWMKAAKHNLLKPFLFALLVAGLLGLRAYWKLRAQPAAVGQRARTTLSNQ
jgi:sulfoxide reductase heme-binding subunit YedZ